MDFKSGLITFYRGGSGVGCLDDPLSFVLSPIPLLLDWGGKNLEIFGSPKSLVGNETKRSKNSIENTVFNHTQYLMGSKLNENCVG